MPPEREPTTIWSHNKKAVGAVFFFQRRRAVEAPAKRRARSGFSAHIDLVLGFPFPFCRFSWRVRIRARVRAKDE
jgi:hypothetical protein